MISFSTHFELSLLLAGTLLSAILPRKLKTKHFWIPHAIVLTVFLAVEISMALKLSEKGVSGAMFSGNAAGLDLIFGMLLVGYFILSYLNMLFGSLKRQVAEISVLVSGFSFLTLALGFSNQLILWTGFFPLVIMIALTSPRFVRGTLSREMVNVSAKWAGVFLFLFGGVATLIFQEWGTLDFSLIEKQIALSNSIADKGFSLMVLGVLLGALNIFAFIPISLKEVEGAKDWSSFSFFRGSLPILSFWILYRWVFSMGGTWANGIFTFLPGVHAQELLFGAAGLAMVWVLAQMFFPGAAVLLGAAILSQSLIAISIGLARGDVIGAVSGMLLAAVYVVSSSLWYRQMEVIGILPSYKIGEAGAAARRAGRWVQGGLFLVVLFCTPLANFLSFSILMVKGPHNNFSESVQVCLVACGAALLAGTVLISGQLFSAPEKTHGAATSERNIKSGLAKVYLLVLSIALIILGIYPGRLYKYLIDIFGGSS